MCAVAEFSSPEIRPEEDEQGALASLGSLEDALPAMRGLSSCFSGKARSFSSLSAAASLRSAADLGKAEHPVNKRRRITMACRAPWHPRASMGTRFRVLEEGEEELAERFPSLPSSSRSFPLSDLRRTSLH